MNSLGKCLLKVLQLGCGTLCNLGFKRHLTNSRAAAAAVTGTTVTVSIMQDDPNKDVKKTKMAKAVGGVTVLPNGESILDISVGCEVEEKNNLGMKIIANDKEDEMPNQKVGTNDLDTPVCWENCDFETAITATGYGRYNMFLLIASLFPLLSCSATTGSMSLIFPSAGCELGLSNFHKGVINASVYVGMISSAFVWGFLSDTLGRQKLLVISLSLCGILDITAALAQNFELLLTAKLVSGFIYAGPFAIIMVYLAECHSSKYRSSIIQWTGVFLATGIVLLPLLAWVIIPRSWEFSFFEGALFVPSWRIFLLVCAMPAVISAVIFYFQHESPKFLMSQGRNEEAMATFRAMYARNCGKDNSTYPVQSLLEERKNKVQEKKNMGISGDNPKSTLQYFTKGWLQIKPLFVYPHVSNAILVFVLQACCLFGVSTIRLWMPQLFSSLLANEQLAANASSVCDVIVVRAEKANVTCSGQVDEQVYINSIIVGLVTGLSYIFSGYLIKVFGKKWLMLGCCCVSVISSCGMYWATSSHVMLAISSIFIAFTSINTTSTVSVVVDLFPTTLRTMAVSLTMMVGRMGAMTGNLIFPLLLDWDCTVPFFLLAAILFCAGLIVIALPNTKGKVLE